ncbi:DUF1549 and DUF1553 domain-containing protein [Gemmata sp. JC717]|uniref:DUF1549 and DUF1553 domain-containing protein n=1 Tax=Gemmata algarum TaxID=2975278 RepID=UPI0021BB2424|nr:DUF1549 and DUF1553 domain-containing protein [Gemmata algarum]MDY3555148.1 DUF1549 and DUF1553 domain-containing protein [Gemmata algarum]
MRLRSLLLAAACTLAPAFARAGDLPPASKPIEEVIDLLVEAALNETGITPAPQADDATTIRRLTLDLVGRIPTTAEVDAYVESTDADKRAKLVDRLMASSGFVRHQAAQFEVMLNPEGDRRGGAALRAYLTSALKENKPWNQIFRDVMLPDETDPKLKGAAEFLRGRVGDADKLTADVSVAFFGVNVSCAQCHNHPNVEAWTQDHFYGMKAFLARTFDNGGFLAERGYGVVKYKPTKGPERTAKMMFLTGAAVHDPTAQEASAAEQKVEKEAFDKAKAAKTAPPAPKFSARAKLVEVALKGENADFFARSISNRLWHRFLGTGLVSPLDQMHSENAPSHPELLAWLSRDTAAHNYDLKRLIRGIVTSKTYSRNSKYEESASVPPFKTYAVARLKPLTPLQLATSLKIAAADPSSFDKLKPDELEKRLEQIESSARGFAAMLAQPTDNFQIGVGEALLFSNGERVMNELLTDGGGSVLGRTKGMTEPKEAVAFLMKAAYGRAPTGAEEGALVAYVEKRKDRAHEAYKQILWALVTAPEFRFSY